MLNQAQIFICHGSPKLLCIRVNSQTPIKTGSAKGNGLNLHHSATVCVRNPVFAGKKDQFRYSLQGKVDYGLRNTSAESAALSCTLMRTHNSNGSTQWSRMPMANVNAPSSFTGKTFESTNSSLFKRLCFPKQVPLHVWPEIWASIYRYQSSKVITQVSVQSRRCKRNSLYSPVTVSGGCW